MAFFTGGAVGAGLSALTRPALAVPAAGAQQADSGHARVYARAAVAVLPLPAGVALAEAAATLPVI